MDVLNCTLRASYFMHFDLMELMAYITLLSDELFQAIADEFYAMPIPEKGRPSLAPFQA